jgi:predicted transcriptional regulator
LNLHFADYFCILRIINPLANFDYESVFTVTSAKNKHITPLNLRDGPFSAPVLGELEVEVMEVLWASGEATAQQVLGELHQNGISLSTVQSTLERLVRKQLLSRCKHGRAYIYRTVIDREQLIGLMIEDVASRFAHGRVTPMISGFCSFMEEIGSKKKARDIALLLREFIGRKSGR